MMVSKSMQNPKGGLNAKGREYYSKQGHDLKPPVKTPHNTPFARECQG